MIQKQTNKIIALLTDLDLEKALSKNVRERLLEQRLFYISNKMSKHYYEGETKTVLFGQDYWKFLEGNISKKEKTAIISLGCGNSELEKSVLRQLKKEGYDFVYIGVDVSKYMLKMATKSLADLDIEKIFIQADMTSESFRDKIVELTADCNRRVYAFFGGTFGNVNQTYMADVLYNLLQKGDLLWLDVVTRVSLSREDDIKLFKKYSSRLSNLNELTFFFGPLEKIGVSPDSGRIGLKVDGEKSVGSLLFIFYFKIEKKIVISFMNEKIHLLPGEEIELINIRAYHPKTLIGFFKEHEFKLLGMKQKDKKEGQFMFRKK